MNTHIPETIKNLETKIQEKTSQIENISIETKEGRSKYGKTKNKPPKNVSLSQLKK